ncbi:MAG: hypothetical protein GX638_06735, partial [Crenarchaeota archaeon]|nr:hypothetical protein [Thermoproteota archaeon]
IVYYWINEVGKTVPLDAGYVALVNCTGIRVEKQTFNGAGECIVLVFTSNSTVQKNSLSYNSTVHLCSSSDNTVQANTFANNNKALIVESSSFNNRISGNNFIDNNYAISLTGSSSNAIAQNSFLNNTNGLYFSGASNNNIYLNNFQSNLNQVSDSGLNNLYASVTPIKTSSTSSFSLQLTSVNLEPLNFIGPPPLSANNWDNGVKGNYWSDYNGTDENGDGVGDTPLYLYGNNQDNYPLMALVNIEDSIIIESTASPSISLSPSPPLSSSLSPSPTLSIVPSESLTSQPTQQSSPTPILDNVMNPTTSALIAVALLITIVAVAIGLFVYYKKRRIKLA